MECCGDCVLGALWDTPLWVDDRCPYRSLLRPLSLSRWRCWPRWPGAARPLGGAAGQGAFLRPLAAGLALPPQPGGTNARSRGGDRPTARVASLSSPSAFPACTPAFRPPPPRFTLVQSCRSPAPPGAPLRWAREARAAAFPALTVRAASRAPPLARYARVRHGASRRVRQLSARPEVMRWRQSRSAPRR